MVGPVNTAASAQTALANPIQQNTAQQQAQQVREREPDENQIQPSGTQAAQSQGTESNNQDNTQIAVASEQGQAQSASGEDRERGSLLDISV